MKVQLTFPTKIREDYLIRLLEKLKNLPAINFASTEKEKGFKFYHDTNLCKKTIQLSSSKANVTIDSHSISIGLVLIFLRPLFQQLSKLFPKLNFLRIFLFDLEEWKLIEKIHESQIGLEIVNEYIRKYGIPDKHLHREILVAVLKTNNIDIKSFKKHPEKYLPNLPKTYLEILRQLL